MNDTLLTATASLGSYLMKVVMEEIKQQRLMWAVTPQQQQQETIDRVGKQVDAAVRTGIRKILGAGLPSVVAKVESITIKDGVKATLTFGNDELHALTDHVGTEVVLVLSDPETHTAGVYAYAADADQQPLDI